MTNPDTQTVPLVPSYIPQEPSLDSQNGSVQSTVPRLHSLEPSSRRRLEQLSSSSVTEPSSDGHSSPHESILGKRSRRVQAGAFPHQDEEASLETKRRRLLEKPDWSGVEFQKPLVVDYSQGEHNTKHRSKGTAYGDVHRLSHLIQASPGKPLGPPRLYDRLHLSELQPNTDLRLRIGSQRLCWSRDGNTVRSPPRSQGVLRSLKDLQSHVVVPRSPGIPWSGSPSTNPPSRSSSCRGIWASTKEPTNLMPCKYLPDSCQCRPSSKNGCPETPRYIVRSEPPMYHPQPSRAERPHLFDIKSPDPDVTSSTIVGVGRTGNPREQDAREDGLLGLLAQLGKARVDLASRSQMEGTNDARSIMHGISEAWDTPGGPLLRSSPQVDPNSQFLGPQRLHVCWMRCSPMMMVRIVSGNAYSRPTVIRIH